MAPQREWFEKDYYRVLGVSDTASQKDIKSAYRKLSRQYHPDANPDDAAAEERFKEVSAAYDVVGDAEKRKEYDEVRKLGPMGGMFGGAGGPGAGGPGAGGFRFEDVGDLGDVLGGLFGRGRRRGAQGGPGRGTGPAPRARTSRPSCTSTSRTRCTGLTTTIHLTSDAACSTCHGSGARPGTTPDDLPAVPGPRRHRRQPGLLQLLAAVPQLRRPGLPHRGPLPDLPGHRASSGGPREVKVRLPAGVADGQRIRLKGRGGPGRNGGPPGDLYVTARVGPHPVFGRRGDDLTLTVPVTYPEAALGADVRVPTLDGGSVKLRIPAGTRSGPHAAGQGQGRGRPQEDGRPARHGRGGRAAEHDRRRAQGGRGPGGRDRRQITPGAPRGRRRKDDERCDPTAVNATRAVYVISVAAELAGVHPQTLRIYERKGLVDPARTSGGSRRYSDADIAQLRRIQELTNEGLNLYGVQRVLELEAEVVRLRKRAGRRAQRRRPRPSPTPTASTAASWCRCSRRWRCSSRAAARADARAPGRVSGRGRGGAARRRGA